MDTSAVGRLVLAGTPIGAASQASPELCRTLADADVIAAEDTRLLRTLLARTQTQTQARIVSYFEGNEAERTPGLLEDLLAGATVVVATDAGMPSVSDPGFRLVGAAIQASVPVTSVPGPSAVTTALAVSGLPCDRFCFEGFLPRGSGPRKRRLAELAAEPRTMVFFEAPHRLAEFLADAAAALGPERRAVLCRELTKPWEDIIRASLEELTRWAERHARGETTIVVAGRPERAGEGLADALEIVAERIGAGEPLSSVVSEVAALTGVRRKELYRAALAARDAR
ncbi:16S rRNA (cytidine(1402)-2'-O)-methyltransferase [Propionibacterium cyclohexanicum]|uniref:16S rRNA (cytidine(1402)-2'-O)-methyltransferase n=1 Tax=Propionibacterium cyclohexanicum TaxID=64702 RepID=UPI003CCBA6DF